MAGVNERKKEKKKNGILIGVIIAVVVVAGIVFAIASNKDKEEAAQMEKTTASEDADTIYGDDSLGIDAGVDEALRDYRNIFIFGIDNKQRSDIIMLASINKKTDEVKLITVHRDTYMKLRDEGTFYIGNEDREYFKCNHAYKKGGFYAAMKELNMNMDLNCHEGMGLDWKTIEILIDGVGGLDADVTPAMLKWANQRTNDGAVIPNSGMQHLNGAQSVGYLRTRYDATAVQRAERNEDAFVQIFEKARALSKSEKAELLDEIYDRADTNMSKNTMADILNQLSKYQLDPRGDWPYDWHLYWDQDMAFYYFYPETLGSNVIKLHEEMFNQKSYKLSDTATELDQLSQKMELTLYRDDRDDFGQQ